MENSSYRNKSIVFYDDECNFCDRSVNFILRFEKDHELYFSHLNSGLAKELRQRYKVPKDLDALLLYEKGRVYYKSDAVSRISTHLRWPFQIAYFIKYFPTFLRDGLYDLVARNRYRVFGRNDCIVPSEAVRRRFVMDE